MLAVKPLGPTAAFSASQIPSEREDAQYDLRGARSYPTLEDEGDRPQGWAHGGAGGCRPWGVGRSGEQQPRTPRTGPLKLGPSPKGGAWVTVTLLLQSKVCSQLGSGEWGAAGTGPGKSYGES